MNTKIKIYLSVLWLSGMAFNLSLAQDFVYHSDSPFGIQLARPDSTRIAQTISFYDYDGDRDLDLLVTGLDYIDDVPDLLWENIHFFIEWQENIGDTKNPLFAPRQDLFTDFPYPTGYFFPTIGDLDNDQDPDFIVSAELDYIGNEKFLMLTNTGIQGIDQFEVTGLDAMGLTDFVPESFYKPHLTDLDRDGDLDLMASGFDSAFGEEDGPDVPWFVYARNVGTMNAPVFEGWYSNPYNLQPSPFIELLTSGDIDNDGDMDFLGSLLTITPDSVNYLLVHLNTPELGGKPFFGNALHSPFGLPTTFGENQLLFPTLSDIDGDGDLDLFVFQLTLDGPILQYYENNACDVDNTVSVQDNLLTANEPNATYQWFNCDTQEFIAGATNQSYTVLTTGVYAVNITDATGCLVVSDCISVIISATEGDFISGAIILYPNPAHTLIYILNDTPYPVSAVTLMNTTGQTLNEGILNGNSVDVSSLEQGVYFIKVKINGQEILKKLIVQR